MRKSEVGGNGRLPPGLADPLYQGWSFLLAQCQAGWAGLPQVRYWDLGPERTVD